MPKLTQKQTANLENILYHAERTRKFIADERTAVVRIKDRATTTLDFQMPNNRVGYEIQKWCGSDLCGIDFVIDLLKQTINPPTIEQES